jgi:hypothetical protein
MSIFLPLSVVEVDLMIAAIEAYGAETEYLPQIRWLVLGPYAASKLFPPTFCKEPTFEELNLLLFILEQYKLTPIVEKLRVILNAESTPIERILSHLETLKPEAWKHPFEVLRRPWHLEALLELCRVRMESVEPERRGRLAGIQKKLRRAHEVEKKAAARRQQMREPKPKKQPRKMKK